MASLFMADIKQTNAEEIYCVFNTEQKWERERGGGGLKNILDKGKINNLIKMLHFWDFHKLVKSLNRFKGNYSLKIK